MSETCIICPLCGYRECGTNICPMCNIIVRNGRPERLSPRHQECAECDYIETPGTSVFCPECNARMEEPISPTPPEEFGEHMWIGTDLVCICSDIVCRTAMDYRTAREIPYCPFCKAPIEERPIIREDVGEDTSKPETEYVVQTH